jgi:AcrR family transcriptional regulator
LTTDDAPRFFVAFVRARRAEPSEAVRAICLSSQDAGAPRSGAYIVAAIHMSRTRSPTFEQQRDAIRASAAQLFALHGYPVTPIAELARSCGVSKALLYHYYRDKEQLLFDIADRYLDSLLAIVDAAGLQSLPPSVRLRQLIERFMTAYEDAAQYHRVLVQDVKYLKPAHRNLVNAKQRRVVQAYADAIVAVAPQLDGSALLKPVTMTLFGMINWTFTWLKDDGALRYADMAPVVADLFLRGVASVRPLPGAGAGKAAGRAPSGRRASKVSGRPVRQAA